MPDRGKSVVWIGFGLVVAGLIPAAWGIGALAEGVTEVPRHWWSTISVLPLLIGLVLTAAGLLRLRHPSK